MSGLVVKVRGQGLTRALRSAMWHFAMQRFMFMHIMNRNVIVARRTATK